jgi:pyruvate/2-oxoglutarate dehydrogenase complex dihydrolipoamide acyltransferase (E2) component
MSADPNVFETANAGFAQVMYEEFLRDPSSVGPEWRRLFESGVVGVRPENGEPSGHGSDGQTQSAATPVAEPQPRVWSRFRSPPPPLQRPRPAGRALPNATPITGPAARLVGNMEESLRVPTATTFRELPVGVLEARRRELNNALRNAGRPEKVSFTHLIGFALVRAAHAHPVMTTVFDHSGATPARINTGKVNLGLAVDVERKDGSRGLVVPVIQDAASGNFAQFHSTYESLVEKARANKLMPDAFAAPT